MDEAFNLFLEDFGQPIDARPVPQSAFNRYQGKLPNSLLGYWKHYGWCGFGRGLFWMVNPQDWDDAMETMLEGTGFLEKDAYHVIARNAFGDLWLWGEKTGASLSIRSADGNIYPNLSDGVVPASNRDRLMGGFWAFKQESQVDLLDGIQAKPLFEKCYKKLGVLTHTEVYGFVPLPALGGAAIVKNAQKLQADVYMDILAQSTPMTVKPDFVAEAKRLGF
jgi:hypothetical protein